MSATQASVRRATLHDAGTVGRLAAQMLDPAPGRREDGFAERFSAAWLADLERRPTWIAEVGGQAAGVLVTAVVRKLPRPGEPDGSWAHVSLVYVVPHRRDAGVGTELLAAMLAWAQTHGVDRVQLNANPDSARLYRRVGFAPAPERLMERRVPRESVGPPA